MAAKTNLKQFFYGATRSVFLVLTIVGIGQQAALAQDQPRPQRASELTLGGIALDGELPKSTGQTGGIPRIRFVLPSNRAAEINLVSGDFDTDLKVFDSPNAELPIQSDDDSGGDNNSRITLVNAETREKVFYLGVESWGEQVGRFRLSALRVPFVEPPVPRLLRLDTSDNQILGPSSPYDGNPEHRYADYSLQIPTELPERVAIMAQSEPVDLSLTVSRDGKPFLSNDDGVGLSPLIVFKPDAGAKYSVRVVGNFSKPAEFSIVARALSTPRAAPPEIVTIGLEETQSKTVHFAPDQPVYGISAARSYALVRFSGKAGDRVEVKVAPKVGTDWVGVQLGSATAAGFALLPNSRLRAAATFREDGTLDALVTASVTFIGDVEVTVIRPPREAASLSE